jgi:O-antigen/teichoic acid export membrane protein
MRSARVLRNVITNYLRFFAGGAISFLLTPLMVHTLGDGGYGLWVMVFSLTGYFGLVDQGIRPSLVRFVSRDQAAGDEEGLRRIINSAIALYTTAGVITMAATVVVAWQFGSWFKIDPAMLPLAQTTVLIAGSTLALGFPLGVFGAVLSGLQRYDLANSIGIGPTISRGCRSPPRWSATCARSWWCAGCCRCRSGSAGCGATHSSRSGRTAGSRSSARSPAASRSRPTRS